MIEGYEVVTVRNIPAPLWVQVKMRAASLKMPIGAFVTYVLELGLARLEPVPQQTGTTGTHGVSCPKVQHVGPGYLHAETDDRPYEVDGVTYCGRCHGWLGTAPQASPTVPPASADTPGEERG